jgi:hypothetical protein
MSNSNAKAQQKWHPQHCFVITPEVNAFAFKNCSESLNALGFYQLFGQNLRA